MISMKIVIVCLTVLSLSFFQLGQIVVAHSINANPSMFIPIMSLGFVKAVVACSAGAIISTVVLVREVNSSR